MPEPQTLMPYDPEHLCPACGTEGTKPVYHQQAIFIVFGAAPEFACSGPAMDAGEHLCNKCESCGYAWMESISCGMADALGNDRRVR